MDEGIGAISNTTGGRKGVYVNWRRTGCFLKSLKTCLGAKGEMSSSQPQEEPIHMRKLQKSRFRFQSFLSLGAMSQ